MNFSDLGFKGSKFTWTHGDLMERLDQGIASQDWLKIFPSSEVRVLAPIASDHSPLWLTVFKEPGRSRKTKNFRFENMWARRRILFGGCQGKIGKQIDVRMLCSRLL